jgi:hypothetical protein
VPRGSFHFTAATYFPASFVGESVANTVPGPWPFFAFTVGASRISFALPCGRSPDGLVPRC